MLVCHCLDGLDGCWYHFITWILSFCTFVWWNKVWKSYLILSTLWIRVINELPMSSYDWNSFISMCEDCRTLVNQLEVYLLKKQCINTKTSSVAQYEWIVKIVPALKFISSNFFYKRLCLENFNTYDYWTQSAWELKLLLSILSDLAIVVTKHPVTWLLYSNKVDSFKCISTMTHTADV